MVRRLIFTGLIFFATMLPALAQIPLEPITLDNVEQLEQIGYIKQPTRNQMLDMAWSSDGSRIAMAVDTGVLIYDFTPSGYTVGLHIRQRWMRSLGWSSDGAIIASGDSDGIVWLWDAQTGERLATLTTGRSTGIEHLDFSPDDKRLAVSFYGGERGSEIWGVWVNNGLQPFTRANAYRVNRILTLEYRSYPLGQAFNPDGTLLATGSADGYLRVWDVTNGELTYEKQFVEVGNGGVVGIDYSADGRLLSLAHQRTIEILDATTYEPRTVIVDGDPEWDANNLALSPDGQLVAATYTGGAVRIFDAESGEQVNAFFDHPWIAWGPAFKPDSLILATLGWSDGIRLWGRGSVLELLPTPTPMPQPTPTATPIPVLAVGGKAVVTTTDGDALNMREGAGRSFEIVAKLLDGTPVTLLEGPQEADGFTWWKVQTPDGIEGWVVEAAEDEQTLTPE